MIVSFLAYMYEKGRLGILEVYRDQAGQEFDSISSASTYVSKSSSGHEKHLTHTHLFQFHKGEGGSASPTLKRASRR